MEYFPMVFRGFQKVLNPIICAKTSSISGFNVHHDGFPNMVERDRAHAHGLSKNQIAMDEATVSGGTSLRNDTVIGFTVQLLPVGYSIGND
jgi:hypothetical protein